MMRAGARRRGLGVWNMGKDHGLDWHGAVRERLNATDELLGKP